MAQLEKLFDHLKKTPDGAFFNPWFDKDIKHDRSASAPQIRRKQLRTYLTEHLDSAKYLFIAEALGYQGGHFTGIAMTSERILLGHHQPVHGIPAKAVFKSLEPCRTSKPFINPKGMTEPTATIMWKALNRLRIDPYEVVLWNAVAWHPYEPDMGMLSNRTPTQADLQQSLPALLSFLKLFDDCRIIAVGKKCEHILKQRGIDFTPVRHPANGGAPKFRKQIASIFNQPALS